MNASKLTRATLGASLLVAASMIAACGSDPSSPNVPGIEPEVINQTDAFQFQVSAVDGYTGSVQYRWSNTGTMANVDQSCAISAGQAMLTLRDPDNQVVYTKDLSSDGSFPSSEGLSGDWGITVEFTDVSGTLNFRAEKATP